MNTKRQTCLQLCSLFAMPLLPACGQAGPDQEAEALNLADYSAEDQALIHKFRGVRGFELYMSGFGSRDDNIRAIGVDDRGGEVVEMAFAKGGDSKHAGNSRPTGPYKYVDFKLYKGNTVKYHWDDNGLKTGVTGDLYGQWRVPVAERIPDDLLDDLRKRPGGGLRIKFRFHPEGVLLGWDIERRPGYDRDKSNAGQYYPPAYSHTGGDFKEMRIAAYIDTQSPCRECVAFARTVKKTPLVTYKDDPNGYLTMPSADDLNNQLPPVLEKNGYFLTPPVPGYPRQIREKGWYIHPKTKQRIEIDF